MVGGIKGNSKIVTISNKYKDTFDNLIDSSDAISPDWLGLIDKKLRNTPKSKSNPMGLSKRGCLDKNISAKLS